jgi:hypothetical protein
MNERHTDRQTDRKTQRKQKNKKTDRQTKRQKETKEWPLVLLARICRGETHFSQKWPLANVGKSGEYSVNGLANVGESGESSVNDLANVGESSVSGLANVGESGESCIFLKMAILASTRIRQKTANFRRVLEFAKFAREWPFLKRNANLTYLFDDQNLFGVTLQQGPGDAARTRAHLDDVLVHDVAWKV